MTTRYVTLVSVLLLVSGFAGALAADYVPTISIGTEPIHSGRITNKLYGGFIEMLDDLIPGMWAEMLNDRGFEGVKPTNWFYYTGEPNFCDREWDANDTWASDATDSFNGKQSARIVSTDRKPGVLSQRGLYVKKGHTYAFSGWFKSTDAEANARVSIKTLLPDGSWMILAEKQLAPLSNEWGKVSCKLKSKGTTEKAVIELSVSTENSATVWADKLSLVPTDAIEGWRPDVISTIKAAKPGIIRFGGSLQEYGYKWQNGIGDKDLRQPFWNQYWGRYDCNDVGIDEFVAFCRAVGAEPLICVGLAEGKESARNLLEYCNGSSNTVWGKKRAQNGHPKPYGVKYWQIGNESWGEAYDLSCVDWCKALLEIDPSITVLAADDTPLVLESAGKHLDYVAHHYYWIKDTRGTEASLIEQQKIVEAANLDHDVHMAITEWNTTAADWGLNRGRMLTLDCGLSSARFLNVLHKHSDFVGIACRSNMTNSLCSGYIVTRPSGVLKTPTYQVMKLYADHYKPVPLQVKGQVRGVDFSACRTDSSKQVTLFAVNTTKEPVRIKLDVSAYKNLTTNGGEVVCDTLDRRQPDIMNHWTSPNRVQAVPVQFDGDTIVLPAYSVSALEFRSKR